MKKPGDGKYNGPCIICGTYKSSGGNRFIKKMCTACYGRMKTTGNIIPWNGHNGPCIVCGSTTSSNGKFIKKMCRNCYRKSMYKPVKNKFCSVCGVNIGKWTKEGKCENCRNREKWRNDPAYRERMTNNRRKYDKTAKGTLVRINHTRKYRAKMAGNEATLTAEEWRIILEKFNYHCAYCKKKTKLEMDHIIPVSKGGGHTIQNIIPACRSCNSSKRDGLPLVSIQSFLL